MRTVIGLVAGLIIGISGASVASQPKTGNDTPAIYCGKYTKTFHACTIADTGTQVHKWRLTYLLNGKVALVTTVCSTVPLRAAAERKGESACAAIGPDGNPATDD